MGIERKRTCKRRARIGMWMIQGVTCVVASRYLHEDVQRPSGNRGLRIMGRWDLLI